MLQRCVGTTWRSKWYRSHKSRYLISSLYNNLNMHIRKQAAVRWLATDKLCACFILIDVVQTIQTRKTYSICNYRGLLCGATMTLVGITAAYLRWRVRPFWYQHSVWVNFFFFLTGLQRTCQQMSAISPKIRHFCGLLHERCAKCKGEMWVPHAVCHKSFDCNRQASYSRRDNWPNRQSPDAHLSCSRA